MSLWTRQFVSSPTYRFVLCAAIDSVDEPELLDQLAGFTKFANHLAVQLELVNGRVIHAVFVAGVGTVKILMGPPETQMAMGTPTLVICDLNVPRPSKTWIRLFPGSAT